MSPALWSTLGIEPTNDVAEIKRAYARRLKQVHPEDDPEGFLALRAAYETAAAAANGQILGELIGAPASNATTFVPQPRAADWDRPVPNGSRVYAPFVETLTIDEMLEEMALDEVREPAHDLLRHRLVGRLTGIHTPDEEKLRALAELLESPLMASSRLYEATEAWLSDLLSRNRKVTEVLEEPCIAFFEWDQPRLGVENPYGRQAMRRRRARETISRLNRSDDPHHKAFTVLSGDAWGPDRLRFRLTFGLRRKVIELLREIDQNPELGLRLNEHSLAWWRNQAIRPGFPPLVLWVLLVAPPAVAVFGHLASPEELGIAGAFVVWMGATLVLWFAAILLHAVVRFRSLT